MMPRSWRASRTYGMVPLCGSIKMEAAGILRAMAVRFFLLGRSEAGGWAFAQPVCGRVTVNPTLWSKRKC